MENNKKNLAKTALAALVLAATLPVASHAAVGTANIDGTFLAAGGCGSTRGFAGCGNRGAAPTNNRNNQGQGSCAAVRSGCNSSGGCGAVTSSDAMPSTPNSNANMNSNSNPYGSGNVPNRPVNNNYNRSGSNGSMDSMNSNGSNAYNSGNYNMNSDTAPQAPQRDTNNTNNWNR